MDLDKEPKMESFWWTSIYKDEDERTLNVGSRRKRCILSFVDAFDFLGYRFHKTGKGIQETAKMLRIFLRSWWWDDIYRAKSSLRRKCDRVVNHVFSTARNGSVHSPRIMESVMRVKR